MHRRLLRAVSTVLVVALVLLLQDTVAVAHARHPAPRGAHGRAGSNTQVVMSGTGPGRAVRGFVPDGTTPFDPVLDGYPPSNPTVGFVPKDEGFAGIIEGRPVGGGPTLSLYCFDLLTDTWPGIGYALGTWDAATVPNVGYVARILTDYYPYVPDQPPGIAGADDRAAAVQAAIWFFSDGYVLNTADALHDTVKEIVDRVIALGPVIAPHPPSLAVTPTHASGSSPAAIVGPFTVTSDLGSATVQATGARMYADAAGTQLIRDGSVVASGTRIWLRSTGPTAAVLQATARAVVPMQNVYLYDGDTAGVADAQRLILALDSELTTTVTAEAEFRPVGSLVVRKVIAGAAAGRQGQVVIEAVCDGTPLAPELLVASGTPAGERTRSYHGIPAGSRCTITETADGTERTPTLTVGIGGDGQVVTVPEGGTVTATVTDTYELAPGSLSVTKVITGDGAGLQGRVVIRVDCGSGHVHDVVIPAGAPAGSTQLTIDGLPANAVCTATEPEDGRNAAVSVVSTGGGTVTVPPAAAVQLEITNTYSPNPGALTVDKTIAGPAAGQQGTVTIEVSCDGSPLSPDFVIPAGATGATSTTYPSLPAGERCTATEVDDGHTATVAAAVTGDNGTPITIPAGGTAVAAITDTYTDVSGRLVIDKVVTGDGAALHGPITVQVECPAGTPISPDFTIPAGAGSASHTITGLAPGVQCAVSETEDGAIPGEVGVATTIVQPPPVASGGAVESVVTDDYTALTGALTVTKTFAGPDVGAQGAVVIEVACTGVPTAGTPPFSIPSGATGTASRSYPGIPVGARCVVAETEDGSSRSVNVEVAGREQAVTMTSGGATVAVSDTVTLRPGSLLVSKILGGPLASARGRVTIEVRCTGVASELTPDFTIRAGTPAGRQHRSYDHLPAGAVCTATEIADGSTDAVGVQVIGGERRTATVRAGSVAAVLFVDLYSAAPGTLVVLKTVAGPAAGGQGPIAILVDCGEPSDEYAVTLAAGLPAGVVSRSFPDLPAGATCAVTETSNGATGSVGVEVIGSGQRVEIAAGRSTTVRLADVVTVVAPEAPITSTSPPVTG